MKSGAYRIRCIHRSSHGAMETRPQTSMLSFYCATREEASSIATTRKSSFGANGVVFASLEEARDSCRGPILVIDRSMAAEGASSFTAEAVLNLDPYMEPEAVTAAGGFLTRRGDGGLEILLIYRRGRWDLPKGKCNAGENIRSCARREVEEEIGIDEVRLIQPLGSTVHGYPEDGRFCVKTTYWFEMATDAESFVPQAEEDIEDVRWMGWQEARQQVGFETLRRHMDTVAHLIDRGPHPEFQT